MDSETQVPLSLVARMNDDASITNLRAWGLHTGEDTLGGTPKIQALYDKQRAKFVDKLESMELRGIIEEYKRKNQVDTFWHNFTPEDCTWQQVRDELQKSEAEYRQKGVANGFRRVVRGGGLPVMSPLVEAIPEDDGLGLLKGGIIVLMNAIKRRSQACDKIFDCFQNVPELIKQTQDTLKRFSTNEDLELRSCADQLYSVIIECLPPLINILLRQSDEPKFKQYGKSIFVDEVANVEKLLQPLTAARRALEQRTARLSDKRHDKTGKQVDEISREAKLIRQNQHQHHYELTTTPGSIDYNGGRIYQQTGRIESNMESVLNAQTAFVNVVSEQNARVNRVHEENAALKARVMQLEMLNSLHMLAEEKRRNQRFCEEAPRRKIEYFQGPNASSANTDLIYNLDQLLTVICNDVESGAHAKSLYSVLEQYYLFSDKALAQAAHLSETPDFRRWLLDKNSGSLLVDGHCGEHMSHMISPLSVFCATLVQSLLDMSLNSQDMVLYFFCGQHVYADGPLSGPQGLIRSLTAQMILGLGSRNIAPNLEFLGELPGLASSSHPEDIDIRTVGRIFSGLLSQLPSGTTVHCVVDDISQFETALYGWAEDLGIVVDCLQWCVFNTDASVFLKPLYTSANASTVVRRQIPLDQQVDLRSGEYYGSVSSPRALMMDLSNQLSFSEPETDEQSEREQIRIRYHGSSGD